MVDLDGVLADFNTPYVALLQQVSGKSLALPEDWVPDRWYYEESLGFTTDEVARAWDQIREDEGFIYNQPDYRWTQEACARLESLSREGDHVYFITSRVGDKAKMWTETWLAERGLDYPTVITCHAGSKWQFCHLLGMTHVLEDKAETLLQIQEACPDAQLGLVPWKYNELDQADIYAGHWGPNVEVVTDIPRWLEALG